MAFLKPGSCTQHGLLAQHPFRSICDAAALQVIFEAKLAAVSPQLQMPGLSQSKGIARLMHKSHRQMLLERNSVEIVRHQARALLQAEEVERGSAALSGRPQQ